MEISKAAAGIFAAVCLTAGASGAWLMTRGDSVEPAALEAAVSPDPAAGAPAAVEQSEAIVSEPEAEEAPAAAPPPAASRPLRRPETQPRAAPRPAPAPEPAPRRSESEHAPPPAAVPEPVATLPALEPAPVFDRVPPPPESFDAAADSAPLEELVVSADSVIGLQVESSLTSERARVEDAVIARVTRDVKVGDRVAIPAGAEAVGEVTLVERGGRMRDRARLGLRFTSIVLADGTRVPVETETIIREGSSPGNESAAKIGGGAIGGAIIGGILGGARGAIIGGSAGAGAGTAAVMAGGRNPATLSAGSPITVRLLKPATVAVER